MDGGVEGVGLRDLDVAVPGVVVRHVDVVAVGVRLLHRHHLALRLVHHQVQVLEVGFNAWNKINVANNMTSDTSTVDKNQRIEC